MNAASDDEVNDDEVAPDPPKNDININDNSDDEGYAYEVAPIHLQVVEILKQLKIMKKQIMKNRLIRKQVMKTLI